MFGTTSLRRFLDSLVSRLLLGVACCFVSLECAGVGLGQSPHADSPQTDLVVEMKIDDGRPVIVVKDLKQPETATVAVWVSGADVANNPPMSGKSGVEQGVLVFRPKYRLRPGIKYNVGVQSTAKAKRVFFLIEAPKVVRAKSEVDSVFPSSDELPENTLKFYLQFTGPMRKGDIYQYVRIQEVGGGVVDQPFLEIEQEFWSRDSTRLTLLLDPGRIKRGLKPREDMGPIFESGKTYEFVVSGDWPDADGRKLGEDFIKRFKATAEDFKQPDPTRWKINPPGRGTKEALVIGFTDSLDHSMLQRVIQIRDSRSNIVEGSVIVSKHETEWRLIPRQAWSKGIYTIFIDSDLEDNAGNSITRQFDVDVFDKTEPTSANRLVKLKFEVVE